MAQKLWSYLTLPYGDGTVVPMWHDLDEQRPHHSTAPRLQLHCTAPAKSNVQRSAPNYLIESG